MAQVNNYGAAPTYVKIASYTAPSAVASYTFSNIPQGYTDLILTINTGSNVSGENISLRFNSDSGSNYSVTEMYSGGSQRESNQARLRLQMGPGLNTTIYDNFIANIMSYSSTTTYKTLVSRHNVVTGTYPGVGTMVGMWRNTAPITSIYLFLAGSSNFLSGSTFTIYGIKAALVPKATGGDIIVQDGTYWYHAFRTTGVFTTNQSLTADVLQVAGGAGGGNSGAGAGGGGAGGVSYVASQSLTASTSYTATVGAGGAIVTSGSNSVFGSLTAAVGGGRGSVQSNPGATGGSGGGGAGNNANTTGLAGTSGQGFAGGTGTYSTNGGNGYTYYTGAGGGGAGAVGVNGGGGTTKTAGNGGAGINTYSTWHSATGTGVSGYIAGGGGGALYIDTASATSDGTGSTGGAGGGGKGIAAQRATTLIQTGTAGTANTGGGGGAGESGGSGNGYAGGSGLIIVRYPI